MAVKIQEVLKADIVFAGVGLLRTQQGLDAFTESVGTEIVVDAPNSHPGVSDPSLRVALNRDRIVLDLAPERSVISRDYPSSHDLDRLAEVTALALANTGSGAGVLQAVGVNIALVYDQDTHQTAVGYLSERLFNTRLSNKMGLPIHGAEGRLTFTSDEHLIALSFQSRFSDATTTKIFMNLNLHRATQILPTQQEIEDSLQEALRNAVEFAGRIDEVI